MAENREFQPEDSFYVEERIPCTDPYVRYCGNWARRGTTTCRDCNEFHNRQNRKRNTTERMEAKYLVQEKMVAIKRAKIELARFEQLEKVTVSLDTELDGVQKRLAAAKNKYAATRRSTPAAKVVVPPQPLRSVSSDFFTEISPSLLDTPLQPSRTASSNSDILSEINSLIFDTPVSTAPDSALKPSPLSLPVLPTPNNWGIKKPLMQKSLIQLSDDEDDGHESSDNLDGLNQKLGQAKVSSPSPQERRLLGDLLRNGMGNKNVQTK